MATSDKLNYLLETKEAIKMSLQNKGVVVNDTDTFRSYASKIDNIETGGGDISEYFEETIVGNNGNGDGSWEDTIKKLPAYRNSGTNCQSMFIQCPVETVDLSNFDTSQVTNMKYMFYQASKLKNADLTYLDTSQVTNMSYMFYGSGLLNYDLSNFDTSQVTDMSYMFNRTEVSQLDFSLFKKFVTNNVTTMSYMFQSMPNLSYLNVSTFNTSKVKKMSYMFANLTKLIDLDISNFDMGSVNGLNYMFNANTGITNLKFGYDLGKGFTQRSANYSSYGLTLSNSTQLTHDSLMSVINNLYDLNLTYDVANGGTLYRQKLVLGSTNLAKLTDEEIAIATNKGWTVS